jgi:hypothetical protein
MGTISEHIFEGGELFENSIGRFFRTTAADGKQYEVAHHWQYTGNKDLPIPTNIY